MAAAPQSDLITVSINDVEIQVPKGELVVESVKRLGLEIPIFCYHSRMKPVGMCRMCLVEVGFKQPDGSVRMMPKPQAGCTMPMTEGMVVYTDSEMVHRDRKGVLEFLLINHPLDCPICDRGGECPLQNNTIFYGPSTTRFTELKRHLPKAFPLSDYVTLDLERCIQCGRCVRFTEEISGDAQLAFRFRGASMQPSTFKMTNFDSKFSGNVIEICPVGALTSSKYRFRARPWDLESGEATCLECANHCSVWMDRRGGQFVRVNGRTNEAVNEEWTCDRGKFGHDWIRDNRSTQVLIRDGRAFAAKTWSDAWETLIPEFQNMGDKAAILVGGRQSNEALFLIKRFADEVVKTKNLDHRWTKEQINPEARLEMVQSTIADLENASAIFIFGTSLADDSPIQYLRVRKAAVQNQVPVIVIHDRASDADSFAIQSIRVRGGFDNAARALRGAFTNSNDESYQVISDITGVSVEMWRAAAPKLGPGAVILTSESMLNSPNGEEAIAILQQTAASTGAKFVCSSLNGNDFGADAIGIVPGDGGKATREILEACARFEINALWLVDVDPFELIDNKTLVQNALEHVDFLVVQQTNPDKATEYASVVLPMTAPAEHEGTYTNIEGRVQEMLRVLTPPGDTKPGWRIFAELLLRTSSGKPYFTVEEIRADLTKHVPAFASVPTSLPAEGALIDLKAGRAAAARS